MALMYDMETVNRAMTEAAKLYDPKHKSAKRVLKVLDIIAAIKPVEVVPVAHGQWEKSDIPHEKYHCSACGGACWYYDYEGEVARSRYCPNCGARMDGRVEE